MGRTPDQRDPLLLTRFFSCSVLGRRIESRSRNNGTKCKKKERKLPREATGTGDGKENEREKEMNRLELAILEHKPSTARGQKHPTSSQNLLVFRVMSHFLGYFEGSRYMTSSVGGQRHGNRTIHQVCSWCVCVNVRAKCKELFFGC